MFFQSDAIVIKTVKSNNNDIFLTLFTKKAGKIEAVANGAKSSKSPLAAASKPFVFGDFMLNSKTKVMKVNSVSVHDSHYRITDDLMALAYGNYILELCQYHTINNVADLDHYQTVIEIIHALSKQIGHYDNLRLAYLMKLSKYSGHQPNLKENCHLCGKPHEYMFSIESGGFVCNSCLTSDERLIKLNKTYMHLMQYLLVKDIRVSAKTNIHEGYLNKLIHIMEVFLMYHNDFHTIHSKDFIDTLKR